MATLTHNSLAGVYYGLTPEQKGYFQSLTKRPIADSVVVLTSMKPELKPTRLYKVELVEVNGVIEPKLILGAVADGDLVVELPYTLHTEDQPATFTARLSFSKYCELNEATAARIKLTTPTIESPTSTKRERKTVDSEAATKLVALFADL